MSRQNLVLYEAPHMYLFETKRRQLRYNFDVLTNYDTFDTTLCEKKEKHIRSGYFHILLTNSIGRDE